MPTSVWWPAGHCDGHDSAVTPGLTGQEFYECHADELDGDQIGGIARPQGSMTPVRA